MASSDIGIVGLRETIKSLEQLGTDVSELKQAMQRIGNIVVVEAQARAPKVSGALASSIKGNKAKGQVTIKAGSAKVPYAGVQHYGWPARNIKATKFITGAAASKREEVIQAISDELDNLISQHELN